MRTFIVTLLILLVSFSSASQDRKAERKARRAERREIRLLEKAVRDSIYLREYEHRLSCFCYVYLPTDHMPP